MAPLQWRSPPSARAHKWPEGCSVLLPSSLCCITRLWRQHLLRPAPLQHQNKRLKATWLWFFARTYSFCAHSCWAEAVSVWMSFLAHARMNIHCSVENNREGFLCSRSHTEFKCAWLLILLVRVFSLQANNPQGSLIGPFHFLFLIETYLHSFCQGFKPFFCQSFCEPLRPQKVLQFDLESLEMVK